MHKFLTKAKAYRDRIPPVYELPLVSARQVGRGRLWLFILAFVIVIGIVKALRG